MNRTALILGGLLVLPLLIFLGASLGKDPKVIDSPLIGQPAPSFTLQDLNGRIYSLADLRGKPVVINFWATWCQPCVVEHPLLQASARKYRDRVTFLGIVYQDDPALIQQFLLARGPWGPSLIDPANEVAIAFGVYGAPETFFLDKEGKIVERVAGLLSPGLIDGLLTELLS